MMSQVPMNGYQSALLKTCPLQTHKKEGFMMLKNTLIEGKEL